MGYDYGIIDAQWLLTRNYHAVKSQYDQLPANGHAIIVSSVLNSLVKFQDQFQFKKILLLFDTYPYFKHQLLSGDYKSSRTYTTDEDVEDGDYDIEIQKVFRDLLITSINEDKYDNPELINIGITNKELAVAKLESIELEILEAEKAQESLRIDSFNLKERGKAKWMLKGLAQYGLPSFYKKGYEADDLAYLMANKIQELNSTALLISIDNDWNYWINANTDWYSPNRGVVTYKETLDELKLPKGLSLFDYKRHYDSFYGSHNDYWQTVKQENYDRTFLDFYDEFCKSADQKELFDDYELFKKQLNAIDIENYPEIRTAHSMMYYIDKSGGLPSKGMYEEWRTKNIVTVEDWKYWKLIGTFDPSLFYD